MLACSFRGISWVDEAAEALAVIADLDAGYRPRMGEQIFSD